MKVQMFNWGHLPNLPDWFKEDDKEYEISIEQISEILALGYQVMIKDWNGSGVLMFCVDDHSFKQY